MPQAQTHQSNKVRDRQFAGNAVQPPVTRQSYQDSDIFGNKTNKGTVQPSTFSPKKESKMRQSNTFASTNVFGATDTESQNQARNAVTRKEGRWESTVFAGPTESVPGRRCLAKEGAGKSGLYGDEVGSETWQKKESFAAQMSKKEKTRPPQFDEVAAQ